MSFSYQIKNEICNNRPFRLRNKKAIAYGLLLFGKTFGLDSISLHTENRAIARLYADSISDLIGLDGSITVQEVQRKERRSIYFVTVDSLCDRLAILSYFGCKAGESCARIRTEQLSKTDAPAFLSGAFLACGGAFDPAKSYQVEFAVPDKALCEDLAAFLYTHLSAAKETVRRNDYLLYYKESEQIEDLLTFIGAPKSALGLMEVKIMKDLRNKVNRETNCETANISKTIEAAVSQIQGIEFIEQHGGLEQLPEELQELAQLRLQNPEMSLRELGESLITPISRSGVNHRLRRIAEFAEQLRKN